MGPQGGGRSLLPPPGSRRPLKRPHNILGDPAAVEVAFLGLHQFVVDVAGTYAAGVKGQVVFDEGEALVRGGVAPSRRGTPTLRTDNVPVFGTAFPFTKSTLAGIFLEQSHLDIFLREVVDRWMAGLQDPVGLVAAGEQMIVPINFDVLADLLQAGRAGIIPDAFLAGAGFDFSFHKDETDRRTNGFGGFPSFMAGSPPLAMNDEQP